MDWFWLAYIRNSAKGGLYLSLVFFASKLGFWCGNGRFNLKWGISPSLLYTKSIPPSWNLYIPLVHSSSKETQLFLFHFPLWPWVRVSNSGSWTLSEMVYQEYYQNKNLPHDHCSTIFSKKMQLPKVAFLLRKSVSFY